MATRSIIVTTLSPVLLNAGYVQVDKAHWRRYVSSGIFFGITISDIRAPRPRVSKAEIICSISDYVIDSIRTWRPNNTGICYIHPSYTKKICSEFPAGLIWNPEVDESTTELGIDAVRENFAAILHNYVIPFSESYATRTNFMKLINKIGGLIAFEACVARLVEQSGSNDLITKSRPFAAQFDIDDRSFRRFIERLKLIENSDIDEIKCMLQKILEAE